MDIEFEDTLKELLESKEQQTPCYQKITKLRNSMFTEPSEAYYMRALSEEKSALVAQPGRAKVS
jgi:hypothetical protein